MRYIVNVIPTLLLLPFPSSALLLAARISEENNSLVQQTEAAQQEERYLTEALTGFVLI